MGIYFCEAHYDNSTTHTKFQARCRPIIRLFTTKSQTNFLRFLKLPNFINLHCATYCQPFQDWRTWLKNNNSNNSRLFKITINSLYLKKNIVFIIFCHLFFHINTIYNKFWDGPISSNQKVKKKNLTVKSSFSISHYFFFHCLRYFQQLISQNSRIHLELGRETRPYL